ncbi:MAG: hypothetical protein CSB44_08915 [Gammaproteobacteria bacterium]|nr:MAG: hypothetical protein CSB44_08915 [Gammaproteobacteria bacterium]
MVARFDGGAISSHGGDLLLRELVKRLDPFNRLAACFTNYRRENLLEHHVRSLLAQRISGIAFGYEDPGSQRRSSRYPAFSVKRAARASSISSATAATEAGFCPVTS